MLSRVLLSSLATFLFLAVSADVIQAQEKLPDGAFTFTSSPDERTWRPFFFVQWAKVYRGPNGYAVDLIRIPPDKEVPPNFWHYLVSPKYGLRDRLVGETGTHDGPSVDVVMRVQSGTLYLAFSKVGAASGDLIAYYPYGPSSVIGIPAGITPRMFAGDEEVVIELTLPRNIPH